MSESTLTAALAAERIEIAAASGWLKQGVFHDGAHYAGLLGAMDPSVQGSDAPCLAGVAPRWLLEWTVPAFDGLAPERVTDAARLYAAMLRAGARFTPAQWDAVSVEFRCWLIADALESARPKAEIPDYWPAVEAAGNDMIDALRSRDPRRIKAAAKAAEAEAATCWATRSWGSLASWAKSAASAARAAWVEATWADAARAEAWFRQFEATAKIVTETANV